MVSKDISTKATREEAFLQNVLEGLPLYEAGIKAGFSTPQRDAYPLLNLPAVRQRFKKIIRGKAETEGLAICYEFFMEVIRDKKNDKKLRLDAAKFVYANNMAAPKAIEVSADEEEKDINHMSSQELRSFIESMEGELADRAIPAEAAQDIEQYM